MASSLTRTPSAVSNSSTASIPTTPSRSAIRTASSCAAVARSSASPGAGASTSAQTPSRCTVSTTGHTATCPNGERATCAESSRTIATRSSASRVPCCLEQVGHLVGAADDEHALAVVAAPRGLQHDRPPDAVGEGGDLVDGRHLGPGRLRLPGLGERPAQHELVLRVDQRRGARGDAVAGLLEGVQVLGRHVLVVEGHDGGAVGEALQGGQVAVVADLDVGGDERGRLGRVGGQHPQRLPEGDRRLVRHPGQLPATDHRHDGRAGARIEGAAMAARDYPACRPEPWPGRSAPVQSDSVQWAETVRVPHGHDVAPAAQGAERVRDRRRRLLRASTSCCSSCSTSTPGSAP